MLALWGWLLVAAALPRVSILVQPRMLTWAESSLRIECRVQRHANNRHLWIGVADMTDSYRQVDGANDRVIHELWVHHLPHCVDVLAYCELGDALGERYSARLRIPVVGCEDDSL